MPIAVHVGGCGLGQLRVALHEDADLALLAHGLLRGGDRAGPADGDRQHQPGKQHGIAHGHDDERVRRQQEPMLPPAPLGASRSERYQPWRASTLSSVISRQPLAAERRTSLVAAAGQPHAPLEAALRQLQAMDDGGAQLARQHARPGNHQIGLLDRRLDLLGVDPRQRNEHEHLAWRLQDVDRRLPGRLRATPSRPA